MKQSKIIKKQLLFLLRGGNAHSPVKRIIKNFPLKLINNKFPNVAYTPWQLLEHLRIALDDILQFIKDADHCSPEWPDGFWPGGDEVADEERWNKSVDEFFKSLDEMEKFIKDDSVDLFTPLPHAENYTIFREILVLADHNSYHLGQIMLMQKLNG